MEKSPDLVHYFSKRAQFDKKKNIFEKNKVFGPPEGPNFHGAQGELPPKPEKSPVLMHYLSKGTQFNSMSGPPSPLQELTFMRSGGTGPPGFSSPGTVCRGIARLHL